LIALFLVKPIAVHDWELIGWQLGKAKLLPDCRLGTEQ